MRLGRKRKEMTSHFGSKGWIIWGRKGVINQFGKCPRLYTASHHTEANGKLGAEGRKRKKKETAGWNMDSNYCFQNNKPVINSVHRRWKDLAQRREQILTCGHKANSQLAFWEKSYVSWAQHLQGFKLFQGKPISLCTYKPFLYSNTQKCSHHALVRKMWCCFCGS